METASSTKNDGIALGRPFPPQVVQILGDLHFRLDGALLALHHANDGTLWSVETPGILRQWSASDGAQLASHQLDDVEELWAFSRDGKYLASASNDVAVYGLPTLKLAKTWDFKAWVTALSFSPDGELIAAGQDDGKIQLLPMTPGQQPRVIDAHRQQLSAVQFSPDGKVLASSSEDRTIALWDVATGKLLGRLTGHPDRIQTVAWHPDNRHLVAAGWDATARVWDTKKMEPVILLNAHAEVVSAVAFSPDGKTLATADSDHVVWLWDPFNGKVLKQFRGHQGEITCLLFQPDGQCLYSGGQDTRLLVWDLSSGRTSAEHVEALGETAHLALSSDAIRLAYVNGSHAIRCWSLNDNGQGRTSLDANATAVAFDPKQNRVAVGDDHGMIRLLDPATLQQLQSFEAHKTSITTLRFSPDGKFLASGGATDGYVYVWSTSNWEPVLLIPEATNNGTVEAVAWLPDSRRLIVGGVDWLSTSNSDGSVCLWDVKDRKKLAHVAGGTTRLAIDPAGKQLAVASLADTICLYAIDKWSVFKELPGRDGLVSGLVYDPQGRRLASSTEDGLIRIWDAAQGKELLEIDVSTEVKDLVFSPDGTRLYVANVNATCYVLDVSGV